MNTVIHIVSNKTWGGGEQYVYDLARRQTTEGYRVLVLCRPVDALTGKFRELGHLHATLPLKGIADFKSAWAVAQILKTLPEPCLLHVHNFKDAFTAAYARCLSHSKTARLVMTRHLVRPAKTSLPYRWLYHQLDWLIFVSDLARREFFSSNPDICPDRIAVIRPAVVLPRGIEPLDIRRRLGISSDATVAMYHGRLHAEKGLDTLLHAMTLLCDLPLHLLLVGHGPDDYTSHLRHLAEMHHLADRIHFAGFQAEVLPYVAAADFGVLPSIVREACPLSAQEYLSQGRPVVSSNHGGQCEYLTDGSNALLVPPADPTALADAMRRLTTDTDLRHRLGLQAKADYDHHLTYDHFYSQMQHLYQSLGL